jgi:y4mF family transcriptional regulator
MNLNDAKAFGAAVRLYRKQLGVNQTRLAGVSGTGLRFISELENGKPTIQLDKALRVAKVLGMNIECGDPK